MSRICLMVLVVAALACLQATMNIHHVAVGVASTHTSQAACGGASSCAMDYPGGYCTIHQALGMCVTHSCRATTITYPPVIPSGSSYTITTYDCNKMGVRELRYIWWNCTSVSYLLLQTFSSTTCGPPTPGECFEKTVCADDCKANAIGVMMCQKKFPIQNFPIYEGFFDETLGDGVGCTIDSFAATSRPSTTIASVLPSFTSVR